MSYLGLKPLSASRQKEKTENKTGSLVNGVMVKKVSNIIIIVIASVKYKHFACTILH